MAGTILSSPEMRDVIKLKHLLRDKYLPGQYNICGHKDTYHYYTYTEGDFDYFLPKRKQ